MSSWGTALHKRVVTVEKACQRKSGMMHVVIQIAGVELAIEFNNVSSLNSSLSPCHLTVHREC
jgi:hypothetical protein